jgi:hypothetical protein
LGDCAGWLRIASDEDHALQRVLYFEQGAHSTCTFNSCTFNWQETVFQKFENDPLLYLASSWLFGYFNVRVQDVGYHDFWAYQVVNRLWARNAFGKLNFKNENLPLSTGSFMEDPLIFPESDGFGLGDSGQFGFLACPQTSKQCKFVLKCNMGRNRLNVTQESIQFETRDWGQNCISPSLIQSVSKQLLHSHGEIEVMVVKNCIGVWRRHDHDSRAAGRVSRNLDTLRVKLSSTHVGVAYFVNTLGSIASLYINQAGSFSSRFQGRLIISGPPL